VQNPDGGFLAEVGAQAEHTLLGFSFAEGVAELVLNGVEGDVGSGEDALEGEDGIPLGVVVGELEGFGSPAGGSEGERGGADGFGDVKIVGGGGGEGAPEAAVADEGFVFGELGGDGGEVFALGEALLGLFESAGALHGEGADFEFLAELELEFRFEFVGGDFEGVRGDELSQQGAAFDDEGKFGASQAAALEHVVEKSVLGFLAFAGGHVIEDAVPFVGDELVGGPDVFGGGVLADDFEADEVFEERRAAALEEDVDEGLLADGPAVDGGDDGVGVRRGRGGGGREEQDTGDRDYQMAAKVHDSRLHRMGSRSSWLMRMSRSG